MEVSLFQRLIGTAKYYIEISRSVPIMEVSFFQSVLITEIPLYYEHGNGKFPCLDRTEVLITTFVKRQLNHRSSGLVQTICGSTCFTGILITH